LLYILTKVIFMKTKSYRADKINVITLGCSKNLVDSENIITQLRGNDFVVNHEKEDEPANVVIINTCGFIDLAKQESINTILEYAEIKKLGGIDKLYVTGCLSQRYKDDLEVEIPEVDAYFGTVELPALLHKLNADYKHELIGERDITTPSHYAYLKISEGCNRTCSFCAIPLMRGQHRSRTIESLVGEATHLASRGVKELMLIAQELTYYGLDIYKKRMLTELLNALADIPGIDWIRLHYAYPSKFPVEIFDVMATRKEICNYLDIPLQHANDQVLLRMRRQITQKETRELIELARKKVPDIAIRTTFLVGFPDESESEFEELCQFIKEMEFERVGVFTYSHEENTSAFDYEDNVAPELKEARKSEVMEIQQAISLAKNQSKIGKKLTVIVDRKEGEFFVGRTEWDSPEVDNEVLINANNIYLRKGEFVTVLIEDATEYDLIAQLV
jgi:ribosomal protein S12 methylthiotransferase